VKRFVLTRAAEGDLRDIHQILIAEKPKCGRVGIDEVMAAQSDLVEPLARLEPCLVKMAPSGEPPED
jgi:hypothetical protein